MSETVKPIDSKFSNWGIVSKFLQSQFLFASISSKFCDKVTLEAEYEKLKERKYKGGLFVHNHQCLAHI